MDYENLMKSMELSAEEKKAAVIEKAEQTARQLIEEAHLKADAALKIRMSDATIASGAERNKALYEARDEVKKAVTGIKYDLLDEAFREAEGRLTAIRENDGYEEFFMKAMGEALEALGENDAVLHIDVRDERICSKVMSSAGVDHAVKADIVCAGGLNVSTPDGKVTVFNTIESRLKSAMERMKLEIFSTLAGD